MPGRSADVLIGADAVVAASDPVMAVLNPARTHTILNTHFAPTAASVGPGSEQPELDGLTNRVGRTSRCLHPVDATGLTEAALGDAIGSNLFLLGHAFQRGWIPLRLESLHEAIELNGAAIEMNRRAFALGRLSVHDAKRLDDLCGRGEVAPAESLESLIASRARDLVDYQGVAHAERYRKIVEGVSESEEQNVEGANRLGTATARHLYKLMAYKDEYEVARLYTREPHSGTGFRAQLAREFEGEPRVKLQLSPPLFARRDRTSGRLRKWSLGRWFLPVLGLLSRLRFLRGTLLDPFGLLPERRMERRLVRSWSEIFEEIARDLSPANYEVACRIAELPDEIRGFDRIKRASVEHVEAKLEPLLRDFRKP